MFLAPSRNRLQAASQSLAHRPNVDREFSPPTAVADMREAQKIESHRLPFTLLLRLDQDCPPKCDQPGLLRVKRQAVLREPLGQHRQNSLRILSILKAKNESSSAGESAFASPFFSTRES